MKQYPSILYYDNEHWGQHVTAFDKPDGSNIRVEYSHKRGFYKFGTRETMINEKSDPFGIAVKTFLDKYSDTLPKVFSSKEYRNVLSFVCFAEFIGTKSRFGQHDFQNDTFDFKLFDVAMYKKGYVHPRQFVDDFGHVGIPKVVYQGELTPEFVSDVQANKFDLEEGVICKGVTRTKKGVQQLYYCKIKTKDWLRDLKIFNQQMFEKESKEFNLAL